MAETTFDLIVIGAGPGGYVCAIRAAQLGMKVACVEAQYLGGTCLNVGCIPSKALLDTSERVYDVRHHYAGRGIKVGDVTIDLPTIMNFKDGVVKSLTDGVGLLFKKNKIEHLRGHGKITAPDTVEVTGNGEARSYKAKHIVIATGSAPIELPGLKFDGKHVLSSTEALTIGQVPTKMIVVGAGYIGVELGSVWNRFGSDVLVLEFLDGILPPSDREMANLLQRSLEKQGLKFKFATIAESAEVAGGGKVHVKWKSKDGSASGVEEVDKVLVCVGRRPFTENLGLSELGVGRDKKGFVIVDQHFTTNVPGIYAIGDVIGGVMLAHKAEEEGVALAEMLAGKGGHVNYAACPAVVYTHPELAAVGLTEEEAKARGPIKVGKFRIANNGRAKGMGETEGLVKVIGDERTDRLLGVHILSAHASDMIHEAVMGIEFAASTEDLARAFHAHPTLPEAIKEAALAVDKRAIHG
jgi:dihydrolipoamide dehydrogenase